MLKIEPENRQKLRRAIDSQLEFRNVKRTTTIVGGLLCYFIDFLIGRRFRLSYLQ